MDNKTPSSEIVRGISYVALIVLGTFAVGIGIIRKEAETISLGIALLAGQGVALANLPSITRARKGE